MAPRKSGRRTAVEVRPGWNVHLAGGSMIAIAEVRFSSRRTLALVVDSEARLLVRAPRRTTRAAIEILLRAKADWVIRKMAEMRQRPVRAHMPEFRPGSSLRYLGAFYPLVLDEGGESPLRFGEGHFKLGAKRVAEGPALLRRWYWERAQTLLLERVRYYAGCMQIAPGRVSLSRARTRWGSCSRTGVRLNWRLIQAPLEVVDYLVVHELAHRLEPNHSARFWAIVAANLSNWRECRQWLKKEGSALLLL